MTLLLESRFKGQLSGSLRWLLPASDNWIIKPQRMDLNLSQASAKEVQFTVSHQGDVSTFLPLPRLEAHFHSAKDGFHLNRALYLPFDMMEHAKKHPTTALMSATEDKPTVDGRLHDPVWQNDPTISRLVPMKADGYALVQTEIWLSYDDTHLYVAAHCDEPRMRLLQNDIKTRDGKVWEDDSIEILLDANRDKKTYRHFAVNANGVLYDGRQRDATWNSTAKAATSSGEHGWSMEMAIPLKDLGAILNSQKTWGLQIARHRPREERNSYQWAPTFWYGNYFPNLYGQVKLR